MSDRGDLKGWPIDLRGLYGFWGWRRRARFGLGERVFEAPGRDACLVLYHAGEIGVGKEAGRLAAYRDKRRPRKAADGGWILFWDMGEDTVQWSGDAAFVFECDHVRAFLDTGPGRLYFYLHVFDFAGGRRARWERRLDAPGDAKSLGVNLDALTWSRF